MVNPQVLAQVPLFAELAQEDLTTLAASLRRRRYHRGQAIFYQDDPGTTLCLIESGHVKIVLTSTAGKEIILSLLGPGDFFGELALLDGEPRSADAFAKEVTELVTLSRDDFLRFLEGNPSAAARLLAALSRRVRRANDLVHDIAFLDVPGRLARSLLDLAETQGEQAADGGLVISTRLTQEELADMVGATRESINKTLGLFEKVGLLRRDGGTITLLNTDELRKRIY